MKKLKILLSDPRHDTVGAHSNYIPIGIGYIGAYLKEKLKDKVDLELYLTTKPEETLSLIEKKKPDIVIVRKSNSGKVLPMFIIELKEHYQSSSNRIKKMDRNDKDIKKDILKMRNSY